MRGVKYNSLSGIKQRLVPVLKRFENDGIIKSYEFERIPGTRPKREMLIVQINHDYFYSARYPRQLIADKQDREISETAKELTRWKISEKTARALVEEKGETVCRLQMEHLAYLKENGKSPEDAASFLIAAIRNEYELPEGFESQEERKRRQNITKLLRSAKRLFDDYQYNNARKAAEKVLEINPQSDAAKKIIDDINYKNRVKEENDRIECWIESCNCEVLETVHSETRQKIKSKMPLMANKCNEEGLKNPLYRSVFYETAKSAMMKREST